MKVEDLIKLTKGKKEYDFSQRIKMKYMPYSEKCTLVKTIIDATSYTEMNGKKVYKRNTASMLFVFTMKLIEMYTDLEFDKNEVVSVYDTLMETGLMNQLMSQIPEEEVSILRGMLDMQRDDEEMNTRSLISFFETKADAVQIMMDGLSSVLNRPEVQAKISEITK